MKIKAIVAQLAVFLLPLTGALFYTFYLTDFARAINGDALHYAQSAQLLLDWLAEFGRGHFVSPQNTAMGRSILLDGLVMPSFGAFLIHLGNLIHSHQYVTILTGQAILAGINALLVLRICRKLGFSRLLSACGGLAWGLYPSQIIASGSFTAEPLAVTACLGLALLLSALLPRGRADISRNLNVRDLFIALFAGIAFVLFLHLKLALFPAALTLLFFTAINLRPMRRALTLIAFFATGAFITLTPWLIFSQAALNHCTLIPDRMVAHNIATGLDLNTDGWGTQPVDERVRLQDGDSALTVLVGAFKERALDMGAMLARKTERLFKHNWNDFHCTALGFPPSAQILLHQMLLLGAGLGLVYLVVMERFLQNRITQLSGSDLLKMAALLMVANHFIYLLFEAQSRYGFTAMPWLLVLTIIGLDHVEHTWHSRAVSASFILAMVLVIINRIELAPLMVKLAGDIYKATAFVNLLLALAFAFWLSACSRAAEAKREGGFKSAKLNVMVWSIFIISLCGSFVFLQLEEVNAPPAVWVCQLKGAQTVEREIENPLNLSSATAQSKTAMVLIDGTESVEQCSLKLNGLLLEKPRSFVSDDPQRERIFHEIARAAGVPLAKIRNWRLATAPVAAIDFAPGSKNIISLTAPQTGATIYGQYQPASQYAGALPALDQISFGQYTFSGDLRPALLSPGLELKHLDRRTTSSQTAVQPLPDLSPSAGEQTGNYRFYLLFGQKHVKDSMVSDNAI